MPSDRTPGEISAERLLADPGLVRRSLDRDLAAIAALGRAGVRVEPGAAPSAVRETLRARADMLTFDSPVNAATQTKRRLHELPSAERRDGTPIRAYHASASATVREGSVVSDTTDSDGSRVLVFHRHAPETGLATVTLSARVRVETDGQTHLEAYGWPTPPTEPVHAFNGTGRDLLSQAVSDLADEQIPFDRPLLLLWGARLREGAPSDNQRLSVAELVTARAGELNACLGQTDDYALMSADEGWYGACLYRSALENLFETYLGSLTFTLLDAEDIDDTDEELRANLSGAYGAAPVVPGGVPAGHWWWDTAVSAGTGR
ncbi:MULTISPECIES: hypothetical protein [Nocardiopsis]|uniref:hypothetical protein n=1 Tax=Nocardiopsis TaxID=2013 RepID=UPI003518B96D